MKLLKEIIGMIQNLWKVKHGIIVEYYDYDEEED